MTHDPATEGADVERVPDDAFDRALGECDDSAGDSVGSEGLRDVPTLDPDEAMGPG